MSKNSTVKLGIVGCGNISEIYLTNGARFKNIEVIACADLVLDRAKEKAAKHNVPKALTVDQILADPDVEIIVNLTVPQAHAEVALAAFEAGKHVYGEKPLTVNREQSKFIIEAAKQAGLRIGCAPDTFFGAAHQTCRKLIDDGEIGEPVAATAFMLGHGTETWHPDPAFFYAAGGGPMLDMGPYYITALVNLIGGVHRVTGSARASFAERKITSQPKYGEIIKVQTPTHIAGTLDFVNGAIATITTSFDVWHHTHSPIEVYGSEGSMLVPDPNEFGGVVKVRRHDESEWREVPLAFNFERNSRGAGVADMASAIQEGRPHRASGDLAYHVLDVMLSILDSSVSGKHIELSTAVSRPAPLPLGLADDEID